MEFGSKSSTYIFPIGGYTQITSFTNNIIHQEWAGGATEERCLMTKGGKGIYEKVICMTKGRGGLG